MRKIESHLQNKINTTLQDLAYPSKEFTFEIPKIEKHGDLSTNVAMLMASQLNQNPRQIAQNIIDHININYKKISKVELAGPGFINFFYATDLLQEAVREILSENENFGKSISGKGKKAQVEFVSANPTGPLTIGHGRQAVLGDTIANLLAWTGYQVIREYYFNNAGRQMQILGESVLLRYKSILGESVQFPEEYYQGEYINEIAQYIYEKHGDALKNRSTEDISIFKQSAEELIFQDIKNTLSMLGIVFDSYYNEKDLYESGEVDNVIQKFKKKKLAYEKDGALWFKSTVFGLDQDRVIVKSSGEPTYRLPDIAYHRTKFERGFDLILDIFGSDHIDTYPDVLAGIKALGYDESKIKVLIHQFVTLYQGREKVKMSKRKATFVTLEELIEEVGMDVTRWFFLMRSMESHLNFDLLLAKTESEENPVYYNQYAHARICSILRNATEKEMKYENPQTLKRLEHKSEFQLIKKLMQFPKIVDRCSREFTPHQMTQYLSEVSTIFHKFYTDCWVLTTDKELSEARLALCMATKTVLANGFKILGVTAPEKM
jgi:arginyl-tRNA synthetase